MVSDQSKIRVRLYVDADFSVGESIPLPAEEIRYYEKVRRKRGPIVLFNRRGSEASGELHENHFRINKVSVNPLPLYDLVVAVAFPESAIIPAIIRGSSELGVTKLVFFHAARTQATRSRHLNRKKENRPEVLPRWTKIAIESARQCGRGVPLEISIETDWNPARMKDREHCWFFDEATPAESGESESSDVYEPRFSKVSRGFAVIGCEGGWTDQERQRARDHKFEFVHFKTPILKVETAVTCASFFCVERMNSVVRHAL